MLSPDWRICSQGRKEGEERSVGSRDHQHRCDRTSVAFSFTGIFVCGKGAGYIFIITAAKEYILTVPGWERKGVPCQK